MWLPPATVQLVGPEHCLGPAVALHRLSTDLRVLSASEAFRLGSGPSLHRGEEERVRPVITLSETPLQEPACAPGRPLGAARGGQAGGSLGWLR